jgi:VWFA-related protein
MTMRPLWIVGVIGLLGASVAAGQQPVFRTATDAVTVNVSVRRNNRPLTNLRAEDFTIRDNGVTQAIRAFVYERLPVDLTVLFDVSGSVTGSVLDQLRRSVQELRRSLRPEDRMQVFTFNMQVRRLIGFTDPSSAIDPAFARVEAGGSSAVRDALAVALVSESPNDRRQFIVLFSDGHDNVSVTSPAQLLEVARRTTPTVSAVLATPTRRPVDRAYLDLAAETGGTTISLLPTDRLGDVLRRSLDQFRSSYLLTYVPTGVTPTGRHEIEVTVHRPEVEVRARKGYQVAAN